MRYFHCDPNDQCCSSYTKILCSGSSCVKSQDYDGPCCVTVCSSIFILDGSSEFCTCVLKGDTDMAAWLATVLSSWQLWGDC